MSSLVLALAIALFFWHFRQTKVYRDARRELALTVGISLNRNLDEGTWSRRYLGYLRTSAPSISTNWTSLPRYKPEDPE